MSDLQLFIKGAKMKTVFNIKGRLLFERGKISKNKTETDLQKLRERDVRDVRGESPLPDGVLRFVRRTGGRNKDGG